MDTARQDLKATPLELARRRLLSGGVWALGGKILIAFIGIASNVLLARLLTPQQLGAYFLGYSIVFFCTTLGTLGIGGAVVRLIAEGMGADRVGRVRRVVGVVLVVGTLGALGVGFTYLLLGNVVAERIFNAPALAAVSGLVAGWIVVETLQGLWSEIFRGFHDIRLSTLLGGQTTGTVSGLITMTLIVSSFFFVWLINGQADLATVLLLAICSGAVGNVLGGWLVYRKIAKLRMQPSDKSQKTDSEEVLKEVFSIAWPLLIASIAMFVIRNADIWVLGIFRGEADVAVYGAAVRLGSMVTMPLIVSYAVLPPLIAQMYSQGHREDLERTIRGLAAVTGIPGALASVACIVFASPILGLVYGDYYRAGATALALLSVGFLSGLWAGSGGFTLTMTGHQKTYMSITIASGLAMVIAMVAVAGPYGVTGIAVVRLVGAVLTNGLWVVVTKQKTGMWIHVGFSNISNLLRIAR